MKVLEQGQRASLLEFVQDPTPGGQQQQQQWRRPASKSTNRSGGDPSSSSSSLFRPRAGGCTGNGHAGGGAGNGSSGSGSGSGSGVGGKSGRSGRSICDALEVDANVASLLHSQLFSVIESRMDQVAEEEMEVSV